MKPPPALNSVYTLIDPYLQYEKRGGIVGDADHVKGGGYHISAALLRANGMSGDYSLRCPADLRGANAEPDFCSGIDITFTKTAELALVTRRVITACTPDAFGKYDPRIECLREVIGTYDGTNVCGYNRVATGSGTRSRVGFVASGYSDTSHRWHCHLSVLRDRCNDGNEMRGLAEVICGLKPGALGWKGDAVGEVPWAWDGKSYPGADRFNIGDQGAWVTWLGKRLVAHGWTGYATGPGPTMSSVDVEAVKWAQRKYNLLATGVPDQTLWDKLAGPAPVEPKPPTPEPAVPSFTVVFANVLRRTDPDKGRLPWSGRVANTVKSILSAEPDVLLANELDQVTAADIAARLGQDWSYDREKGVGLFWRSSVFERRATAVAKIYSTKDNRYLLELPLVHKRTGRSVTFNITHLENDGDPETDGPMVREIQAKQLAAWTTGGVRVLGADFNSTSLASTGKLDKPRPILAKYGWRFLTAQPGVGNRELESHHGGHGDPVRKGPWIDDIGFKNLTWMSGGLIRTDRTRSSDHHFLWSEFKLN